RQIVDINHVRVAAAALRRMDVDRVLVQIQRVWLAVGRHEFGGVNDLFAGAQVYAAQAPVPRSGVDDVFAFAPARPDDWRGGDAARTQVVGAAPAIRWRRPVAIEMQLPDLFARLGVKRVKVVGDARHQDDLFRPAGGFDVAGDERRQQVVHLARLVV